MCHHWYTLRWHAESNEKAVKYLNEPGEMHSVASLLLELWNIAAVNPHKGFNIQFLKVLVQFYSHRRGWSLLGCVCAECSLNTDVHPPDTNVNIYSFFHSSNTEWWHRDFTHRTFPYVRVGKAQVCMIKWAMAEFHLAASRSGSRFRACWLPAVAAYQNKTEPSLRLSSHLEFTTVTRLND